MDIFRFINSKDIRKHLKDIDYKFNSLEAAWLIYQCHDATIDEKHKAWNELIDTMPDCKIEERYFTDSQESLHAYLKQYMKVENKLIKEFYDEKHTDTFDFDKPFVYKFEYIYKNGNVFDWTTVFSCFDALFESLMEPEEDVVFIKCTKMQIDRLERFPAIAYLTPEFDILKFDPGPIEDKADEKIYCGVFDGLWFEFPTPFKKGDIVWDPNNPKSNGTCGGPFVMTGFCLDDVESEKEKENVRKNVDFSHMYAKGIFINEDGSIYNDEMWSYMDLEFYENELSGTHRTLIALSNYLKDEIDPALFARAYHQILTAGYAQQCMPGDYSDTGLELAGLPVEKNETENC